MDKEGRNTFTRRVDMNNTGSNMNHDDNDIDKIIVNEFNCQENMELASKTAKENSQRQILADINNRRNNHNEAKNKLEHCFSESNDRSHMKDVKYFQRINQVNSRPKNAHGIRKTIIKKIELRHAFTGEM